MSLSLAVIGGGNMARSIITGAVHGNVLKSCDIAIADPDESSREYFAQLGCLTFEFANELPDAACVLLAVKPQVFELVAPFTKSPVVYSIMAGVSTSRIAELVGHERVVRVMPNLPCSIGQGAAGIALGEGASEDDAALARTLFCEIGIVVDVPETLMDAVTAVSGSGPAYVFLLAESMIEGGIHAGLDPETADVLVRQTLLGASMLLAQDQRSAGELREAVTSKGGTTAAALELMNERHVQIAIADAVVAATDRGKELG